MADPGDNPIAVASNTLPKYVTRLEHFILTFHDSTLECAARAVAQVSVRRGTTPRAAVRAATDALD
jgi:hypothetical protein